MEKEWFTKSMADLIGLYSMYLPSNTRSLMFIVFVLIVVDTITGVIRHVYQRTVSSRNMRMRLLSKLACYFGFVTLGGVASLMSKSWLLLDGSYAAIIFIEFTSLAENVTIFAKISNINFGPLQQMLDNMSLVFVATQETTKERNLVIQSTTTIPDNGPATETTHIETIVTEKPKRETVVVPVDDGVVSFTKDTIKERKDKEHGTITTRP